MGFGGSGRCGDVDDVGKAFKDLEFRVSVFLLGECPRVMKFCGYFPRDRRPDAGSGGGIVSRMC